MNMPYDKNMLIPVSAARVDDNFMDAEKCFLHIRDHLRNKQIAIPQNVNMQQNVKITTMMRVLRSFGDNVLNAM